MNQEFDREDETILAALDALAGGGDGSKARAADGDETLHRLYVELLGLLPCALEPVAPSADLWQRLEAQCAAPAEGDASAPSEAPTLRLVPPVVLSDASGAASSAAADRPAVASLPPDRLPTAPYQRPPQAPPLPASIRSSHAASPPPPRSRPSRWPLALAAALVLALAGLSAWLYQGYVQQQEEIASLTENLVATQRKLAELHVAKTELSALEAKFQLVTKPTVAVGRLAPAGERPLQPGARGILFVAADHQHWFLSLEGLAAAESGQRYQLWFLAPSGPVSGGTFTARPGEPVELTSAQMPAGTQGLLITVEPETGSPAPTGPQVLTTVG